MQYFLQIDCDKQYHDIQFLCEYNLPFSHETNLSLDVMCDIPWTFFSNVCILLKELNVLDFKDAPTVSGTF